MADTYLLAVAVAIAVAGTHRLKPLLLEGFRRMAVEKTGGFFGKDSAVVLPDITNAKHERCPWGVRSPGVTHPIGGEA